MAFETKTIVDRADRVRRDRSAFETHWRDLAKFMLPNAGTFSEFRSAETGNQRRHLFTNTVDLALDSFVGGLFGTMTNPAQEWFSMTLDDRDLASFEPVQLWLNGVTHIVLRSLMSDMSAFYRTIQSLYSDIGVFSNGVFYSEIDEENRRFIDVHRPLSEISVETDIEGDIVAVYRWFRPFAEAVVKQFPDRVSSGLKDKAKNPSARVTILHAVYENPDGREGASLAPELRPFLSDWIEVDGAHRIRMGGFHEMPYNLARWGIGDSTLSYGLGGPGDKALNAVKSDNVMWRTVLRIGNRAADPDYIALNERQLGGQVKLSGGSVIYGAVLPNGRAGLQEIGTGRGLPLTLELIRQKEQEIRDSFFFSLLQLVRASGMSPVEVLERQEEQMRLMGPHLGRLETELLTPFISRRFRMLERAGEIPEPPGDLRGRAIVLRYNSPLANALRVAEAQGVLRFADGLGGLAQLDPTVIDNLDVDEAARVLRAGFGPPPTILRDRRLVEELRANRNQQQAVQQALATGADSADIAARLATAGAAAQQQGGAP